MSEGTTGLIVGCIGLAMLAGAGIAYVVQHELRPPSPPAAVPLTPPKPALLPQPPVFGPVPHVTINTLPAPAAPIATPEPAPAAVEKKVVKPKAPTVKKKKRKASPAKKLQTKWSAPKHEPSFLEKLFNGR